MASNARKSDLETPLCVDLDGTLIHSDMMFESLVRLLGGNPLWLFPVLIWWMRGRAHLKARIAEKVTVDAATLPYNKPLIDWIRAERSRGRRTLLVTASDMGMVRGVPGQLPIFDEVLASDGKRNLRGRNKGRTLAGLFGEKGFDYAGNSTVDLPVWERARKAIVVNGSPSLVNRAGRLAELGPVFPKPACRPREFLKLLSIPDLVGNVLYFLPVAAAVLGGHSPSSRRVALGFLGMLLCGVGSGVLSELLRIESDRTNPRRRARPFASGALDIHAGATVGPALCLAGLLLAGISGPGLLLATVLLTIVRTLPSASDADQKAGSLLVWTAVTALRLLAGAAAVN
jgi:hypothetical protein